MIIFILLLIISPHIHFVNGQFELHDNSQGQGQSQGQGKESQAQQPSPAGSNSKPAGGADKPPGEEPGGEKPQPQKEGEEGPPPPRTDEFDDYLGDYEDPPSSNDAKKDKNMFESTENANESISGSDGGSRGGEGGNEDTVPENSSNRLNISFYFILLSLSTIFTIKINIF